MREQTEDRQTDRRTEGQTDRWTDRQTGGQTRAVLGCSCDVTSCRVCLWSATVTCTNSGRYVLWCSFHALAELAIRNYKKACNKPLRHRQSISENTYWSKIGFLLRKYETCAVQHAGSRKYLGLRSNVSWRFEDTDDHKTAFVMDWEVPGSNVGRRAAVVFVRPFSQILRYDGQLRHC